MAPKKYSSKRRREERTGGNEILGVILVIFSAFILLCICITPILGDISLAIRNLLLGLLGFFAYPLFASLLLLGIALLRDWKLAVTAGQVVGIVVTVVCTLLLLQLVTSYAYLGQGFGTYVDKVYHGKSTVGGLLFGVIFYGVQAVLGTVVSGIVFGLGAIVAIVLTTGLIGKIRDGSFGKKKVQQPPEKKNDFEKRGEFVPVRPLEDRSLFVGKIEPPMVITATGNTDSMRDGRADLMPVDKSPYGSKRVENIDSDPRLSANSREEARKLLFGDKPMPFTESYSPDEGRFLPPETPERIVASPTVRNDPPAKPPKYVHDSIESKIGPVVFPVNKDISYDGLPTNEIIDGEEQSRELAKQRREEEIKKTPPTDTTHREFDTRKKDPSPMTPRAVPPVAQNPIVIGDATRNESYVDPIYQEDVQSEPEYTPPVERKPYTPPTFSYDEPERKSPLEDLFADERRIRDSIAAESFDNPIIDGYGDTVKEENPTPEYRSYEDQLNEYEPYEGTKSAFEMIDETEDLSETRVEEGKDFTGIYNPIDFAVQKPEPVVPKERVEAQNPTRNRRGSIVGSQITIDDFARSQPLDDVKPKKKKRTKYNTPPIELLSGTSTDLSEFGGDCEENSRILEQTLANLRLEARVIGVTKGPAVTRYELETPPGTSVKKIDAFAQDIEYNLACKGKVRIETPIPGKRAVGIEVPNETVGIVALRDVINSKEFKNASSNLTLAIGKDIAGQIILSNLEKMPHLLIAGSTGSGKSACLNSIIMSILYKSSPDDVRLILIDPKLVEFSTYRGMPHLLMNDIVTSPEQALNAFKWAKIEMDRRYSVMSRCGVNSLSAYNNSAAVKNGEMEKWPAIVIIVDELSELMMMYKREFEEKIMSIAQKARAAGIHLILATQRPSVDVITGTIKTNLPSRIAFAVTSVADSRTILDQGGADSLLGRGDMLYAPIGVNEPRRVQGAYVTPEETIAVINYVKEHNECDFDEDIDRAIMSVEVAQQDGGTGGSSDDDSNDALFQDAVRRVVESGKASVSMLQARFSIGYARAARIIDQMEVAHLIGPSEGSKPREVYIDRIKYKEMFGEDI